MNAAQPLHTNDHKKIVFIFAFFASAFFNVLLFSSIGTNPLIRTIWGVVGVAAVFFQAVKLREFFNSTERMRFVHLSFYIICTILSIFGTLGTGYAHIEKTKLKETAKNTKLEIINLKIINIENKIKNYNNNENALNSAMAVTNPNQWAVIRLQKEKKIMQSDYDKKIIELESLKIARASHLKNKTKIISALSGIAKLLNQSEEKIAFIFLIFSALIIELMVYGSASFDGKLFTKKSTKELKKKSLKENKPDLPPETVKLIEKHEKLFEKKIEKNTDQHLFDLN